MAKIGSIEWIMEECEKNPPRDYSKYYELKEYKQHIVNNVYILDEPVNYDELIFDNNFTGGYYYDLNTKLVVAYTTRQYLSNLHAMYDGKNLGWGYTTYRPRWPEIVHTAKLENSWTFSSLFGLRVTKAKVDFKMDTGATFSAINFRDLLTQLKITEQQWYHYLNTHKYATVTADTASEKNVSYISISARLSIFDKDQPIILYVDLNNRLNTTLLGFDVISSFNLISHAGEDPVITGFSEEHYKKYVYEHRRSDNATYDLYQILTIA